jgi:hypothetical protein
MFVEVNVSFPHVTCDLMTLDALDSFGEFQPDMAKKTVRHRIEPHTLTYIDAARPIVHGDKKATVQGAATAPRLFLDSVAILAWKFRLLTSAVDGTSN